MADEPVRYTTYGPFGESYNVEQLPPIDPIFLLGTRFGFRGAPAMTRGPWTRPEPRPNVVREAKQPGDDSIAQNVYEALLGRLRQPGEAVARPGSGWWMVGNQPIPKFSNPLPWAVAAGGGYLAGRAGYNAMDSLLGHPGTPEYEADRLRRLEELERERDKRARTNAHSALYQYGGVNWPWQTDQYAQRRGDAGIPPLPDAPY